MTILDDIQTWQMERGTALSEAQMEALGTLPGVNPWRRYAVSAPRNAVEVVGSLLERWKLKGRTRPLKPHKPVSEAGVRKAALKSELHDWLWEDDSERRPTSGFALTEYQIGGICHVASRGGGALWMPPGAGKTITAIAAALIVPGGVLIVTKAGARETQRRELVRCTSCTPFVIRPKGQVRKRDRFKALDAYLKAAREQEFRPVVIMGWEQLPKWKAPLLLAGFRTIIWDEIHKGKSRKREKWRVAKDGSPVARKLNNIASAAYALACAIPRRIATTATAVRKTLDDLWAQLTLVEPRAWGRTATRFLFRYCDAKPGEYGLKTDGVSNVPELVHRLSSTVYRVPFSVIQAQLPPRRRLVMRLPPETCVKPISRSREEAAEERQKEKRGEWANGRERGLFDAASAKRKAVLDLVIEHLNTGKGKIMVFSGRQRDVEELGKQIYNRTKVKVWASHGGDSQKERQRIQDEYMGNGEEGIEPHSGPCVLVASVAAWGESLNLQDTDVLICAMLPTTPGEVDQMEGRGYRLGMTRGLLIIYPIAEDTYDEHVQTMLIDRLSAVEGVASSGSVEGLRNTMRGLDRKDEILAGISGAFGDENTDEWGFNV